MTIGKKACAMAAVAAALAASLLAQGSAKAGNLPSTVYTLVSDGSVPVQVGGTLATRATEVETQVIHLGPGRYIIGLWAFASAPYGGTGDDRVYPEFVVNGRTIYGSDRSLITPAMTIGGFVDPAYNYGTNAALTAFRAASGVITTHGLTLEVYAWGRKIDADGIADRDDASGSYNLRDLTVYIARLP